jgi:hypothetical protein
VNREIRGLGETETIEAQEDEVRVQVVAHAWNRELIVRFDGPVSRIRLTADQAEDLRHSIQEKLWELRGIHS